MMMAGRAAEELIFGEFTSGAADDLNRAATLARRMVAEMGMGSSTTAGSLASGLPGAQGHDAADRIEAGAHALIDDAFRSATTILLERLELLHAGAARLLEEEALERDDLSELFGPRPESRRLHPLRRGSAPV